jgi:hypothetical protein
MAASANRIMTFNIFGLLKFEHVCGSTNLSNPQVACKAIATA